MLAIFLVFGLVGWLKRRAIKRFIRDVGKGKHGAMLQKAWVYMSGNKTIAAVVFIAIATLSDALGGPEVVRASGLGGQTRWLAQ